MAGHVVYLRSTCTRCGGGIEFDANYQGDVAMCPHCGVQTPLLASPPTISPIPDQNHQGRDLTTKECPFCGTLLRKAATKCKHCGGMVSIKGEDIPRTTPCKACGEINATISSCCTHCGQAWPCLPGDCPGCRSSDFDILVEQSPSQFILLPLSPAGVIASVVGSIFQSAIDKALPNRRFMRCRICGGDFLPSKGLATEFFKSLPLR